MTNEPEGEPTMPETPQDENLEKLGSATGFAAEKLDSPEARGVLVEKAVSFYRSGTFKLIEKAWNALPNGLKNYLAGQGFIAGIEMNSINRLKFESFRLMIEAGMLEAPTKVETAKQIDTEDEKTAKIMDWATNVPGAEELKVFTAPFVKLTEGKSKVMAEIRTAIEAEKARTRSEDEKLADGLHVGTDNVVPIREGVTHEKAADALGENTDLAA
ncbi:MAG: hypothetical protein ACD_63C00083G0002 [uncultured bacterium]|nr:MAG: hypothetical protein ACD_63C00083G0002 [uncultured bacterium]